MYEIYTSTRMNLVWLGPDDEYTAQAIDSITLIHGEISRECDGIENMDSFIWQRGVRHVERRSSTGLPSVNLDNDPSLLHFLSSPWFGRLWVVEEASLAPVSVCYYGKHEIPLVDVLRAAKWLRYKLDFMSPKVAKEITSSHAVTMFDMVDKKRTKFSLHYLLYALRAFRTFDPRDHVFAILGMSEQQITLPGSTEFPRADYALDVCDAFRNATRYAIEWSRTLWALEQVYETDQDFSNWSSWVPRWNHQFNGFTDPDRMIPLFRTDDGVPLNMFRVHGKPNALGICGLGLDTVDKLLPIVKNWWDSQAFLICLMNSRWYFVRDPW
jgi:hypothetical protein